MKKLYYPLLFLISSFSAHAGDTPRRGSFAEKDIFQSAYFLRNVPGLVNDYHGQPVLYLAAHDGVCVFFTESGPIYKLVTPDEKALKEKAHKKSRERRMSREEEEEEHRGTPTRISYTTMHWMGANLHPKIEAVGKNTGTYTFLAGTPDRDLHSIVTDGYKKIIYHDVYPGIDVEYSFPDQGGMKYDLIVHPGADASLIRMEYGGAARSLQVNAQGNMTVHTETGDLMEHTPASYTAGGAQVASAYDIQGTSVGFSLPAGYDHSRTLTIDPWITVLTQLTVQNLGADVDYDVPGNLYVYGAGGTSILDVATTDYEKVAKYSAGGIFQWVFGGSVAAQTWSTTGGTNGLFDFLSNMKVDRINETVYVGCGFYERAGGTVVGVRVVELNNSGVYNNFISTRNANFTEVWSFVQNCTTGDIIGLGGGTTSNLTLSTIAPSTGTVTTSNFTGIAYNAGGFFTNPSGYGQDVVSGAEDSAENLYVLMASEYGAPQINNKLYRVNAAYNGNVWGPLATGYNSFKEASNMPVYSNNPTDSGSSNNFNALAVNMSYLYYYDGANLKAFNPATGAAAGTAITIPGQTALWQGGIAVDRCNNVYLGGIGQILTYTFSGSTFTAGTPISLGTGFTGDTVFDVRYDALNNLLYVTGTRMAGTYTASLSTTCVNGIPYTDTVRTVALTTVPCSFPEAIVDVTVGAGAASLHPEFTYVWQDSLGNILRQSGPDTLKADTFTPPGTGKFTVQVELNENCGQNSLLSIIYINSRDSLVPSPDTTICPGQPVTLSAVTCSAGGAYLWEPGGATTPTITVSPTVSTAYAVRYTPLSGQGSVITDSIHITVPTAPTVAVTDTSVCPGQPGTLTATASVLGRYL